MRYTDALTMADNVMTYRLVVKQIAMNQGVYASFMPKPVFGINGSVCMCTNRCLKAIERLFDAKGKYFLSKLARSYVAVY